MSEVRISEALRQAVSRSGAAAERWLEAAPAFAAEVTAAWGLEPGDQLDHVGSNSLIFTVTTPQGQPAILKLGMPHDDAIGEAPALTRWSGRGAVHLLPASPDGFTMLLERCLPGTDLWTIPPNEQIEVVAALLPRLWLPADDLEIRELSATVSGWRDRMRADPSSFDAPAEVVRRTAAWAEDLTGQGPCRLLHGDLNPGNVLLAEREPWLAIDPKPWLGDPAFDLAQLLANWVWRAEHAEVPRDDVAQMIAERATELAGRLSLDTGRVLRWAAIKAVAWDNGREHTQIFDAAVRLNGS